MTCTPAQRRYNRRIIVLSIIYAAILLPVCWVFVRHLASGPLAYALGVAPALPVSGFFAVIGLYFVEETDEYLRMLMARQVIVASGLAMTVATFWGFLENFGLVPHLVAYAWPIVWFAGLGLGALVNKLIDRSAA
ncbi:hypothetical protein [Sphingomonas sp. GV3]|uniref:hypothetical protein n=1 Tax=Sphingomonas sp. GV3 TaxID=3040671 RepID=UPI00280BD6C2|nr:hypothetical protein [Sphingomonas sp. GV3]